MPNLVTDINLADSNSITNNYNSDQVTEPVHVRTWTFATDAIQIWDLKQRWLRGRAAGSVINRRARMEVIIAVYVTPLINLFLKRRHRRTCSNEID